MVQRVVSADGTSLAVAHYGDASAPVVLCLHGYPDNRSMWDAVVAELSGRYRVVTYDVRGAGESDAPRGRHAYHLDRLAEDLAAVVDKVSPQHGVHLLAHDWGSIQAWHALTGQWLTGRVKSYTSISGPSLDHAGAWLRSRLRPRPKALRELVGQLLHSAYIGFFQLPVIPELAWRTGVTARLLGRMDNTAQAPDYADARNGLQLYRENMLPRLTRPRPLSTDVPVQVLAPSGDAFVTAPLQTGIAEWVSELRVRKIPTGHWMPRSRPDVIARCVAELADYVDSGHAAPGVRRARVNPPRGGRFDGHLVVVTGAGSGIGRASALAFAEQGADVALTDVDGTTVHRTAELARRHGIDASAHLVDVSDAEAMQRFAKELHDEHGAPDVVVNNAGIAMAGPFLHTTAAEWERIIDVNLWGVIHGCRAFAAQMAERGEGGRIVNVASAAAYLPSRMLPAYATTKSAVLTLSECLRAELAEDGIGVTAVCPGFVHTPITSSARFVGVDDEEQQRRREATTAAYRRRNYPPEKVATAILRAVERDTPLAPITPEAHAGLALSRLTPGLLRGLARRDLMPR